MKQKNVSDILAEQNKPVIAIDEHGLITYINDAFEVTYGWTKKDLVGQTVTAIMPPHMRDSHNFGFSRFLISEQARILDQSLQLPLYLKDGTTIDAEHYITGEKTNGAWSFAATITPKQSAA